MSVEQYVTLFFWYAKPNYKYTKDYDKKSESSYLQYWDINNLYGWAMPQKLPVNINSITGSINIAVKNQLQW